MGADGRDPLLSDAVRAQDEYARRDRDDRLAQYYRRIQGATARAVAERRAVTEALLRAQGRLSGLRILDVGCGDGQDLAWWVSRGAVSSNVTGVDIHPPAVAAARERLPSSQIHLGSAASLPFADGSQDVVLQTVVLSSVVDPQARRAVALECLRVLAPGGLMVSYDMRAAPRSNPHLVSIDRAELARVFGSRVVTVRDVTLSIPIASRLPARTVDLLVRLPVFRTHLLAEIR